MKHTKIVATISDKRCDAEFVDRLVTAGVNVVRLNSAHLDEDGVTKIVNSVREVAPRVALMIDTKGPEIRTTKIDCDALLFNTGDVVEICGDPSSASSNKKICLNYPDIVNFIKPGDHLLIDDGELSFVVTNVDCCRITAKAENEGKLGSRKSVNIPGVAIPLPSVTSRDREMITIASRLGIDFVAHSFVRSAADVHAVQQILDELGSEMKIISKIENQEGVDNFDEILEASYGIMVARGDLGIEVAIEMLPGIQQSMIKKCIAAHKPVIVATQMLHTMIEHPRPTRAEVSDVANAVYQGADALMLSGETASGRYPIEAVETMSRIAIETERELTLNPDVPPMRDTEVASYLARQAVVAEKAVGVKAILTDTHHGGTARYMASYRAVVPLFAICYNERVARLLALSYGVETSLYTGTKRCHSRDIPNDALRALLAEEKLKEHELVAYISGTKTRATTLHIDTIHNLLNPCDS